MVDLKNEMLRVATSFIGIDSTVKNWLVDYYNLNCVQYVKKSRKYKLKYSDSWCAMFVSVCAHKVGLLTVPFEVSVNQMCLLAKLTGTFTTDFKQVSVGDLIIYNWNSDTIPDHVGIVADIKKGVLTVVEGNYTKTVKLRTVTPDSVNIYGYIKI